MLPARKTVNKKTLLGEHSTKNFRLSRLYTASHLSYELGLW